MLRLKINLYIILSNYCIKAINHYLLRQRLLLTDVETSRACHGVEVSLQMQNSLPEICFFSEQVSIFLLEYGLGAEVLKALGFDRFTFHQSERVLKEYSDGI